MKLTAKKSKTPRSEAVSAETMLAIALIVLLGAVALTGCLASARWIVVANGRQYIYSAALWTCKGFDINDSLLIACVRNDDSEDVVYWADDLRYDGGGLR